MNTAFTFIDNSHIDPQSRRTIRSHVMKGRNVGKVRAPKRQLHQVAQNSIVHDRPSSMDANKNHDEPLAEPVSAPFSDSNRPKISTTKLLVEVGNELSTLTSPFEITPQSRRSIHNFLAYVADAVYPSEFCNNRPDPSLTIWFQYLLIDEAFFHCFVAVSEACIDFVMGNENQSSNYLHHMASALRLIKFNLSSSDALTDTNLASVIYLCLLSSVREQPLQTKVHFDGLCCMIKARGGIDELISNPGLIEKTRRIDIDLALQLGSITRLGRSTENPETMTPSVSNSTHEAYSVLLDAIPHTNPKVLMVARETIELTDLLNSNTTSEKLSAYAFQDVVTTTFYHLLEIKPLNNNWGNMHPIADAIHLGLLSFMTTFLIQIGRRRYLRYKLLSCKLINALDNAKFLATVDPETHLWLLVIAGISVIDEGDYVWLKHRLTEIVERLDRADWGFVVRLLAKYPWVNNLHDRPASDLWATLFPVAVGS